MSTRREMMRTFTECATCRWSSLCGYLGAGSLIACGHCDVCRRNGSSRAQTGATRRARHTTFEIGTVVAADEDTLTVLFDDHGYRTLSRALVEGERLLVDI
ncbi:MAG: recombinase RecQ [Acidimicrobiales bacterium]|nr:recombinase RecQ [Acidimicrobiales bacterium]